MKTEVTVPRLQETVRLYALSPDYHPDLRPGHVLFDQSLPVEERIERAQAESIGKLNSLRPQAEGGDTRSQIEFAKEAKLLQWLCGDGAKGWVEEHHPWRDSIFTKYQFKVLDDGFVRFTLPKGTSYLELFEEANSYCQEIGREGTAMHDATIWWFAERAEATNRAQTEQSHEIHGLMPGGTGKSRAEQEKLLRSQGLEWAGLEAAVAAAVLYSCAMGKDLSENKSVRTADYRLGFESNAYGLFIHVYYPDFNFAFDHAGCAASRNLAAETWMSKMRRLWGL